MSPNGERLRDVRPGHAHPQRVRGPHARPVPRHRRDVPRSDAPGRRGVPRGDHAPAREATSATPLVANEIRIVVADPQTRAARAAVDRARQRRASRSRPRRTAWRRSARACRSTPDVVLIERDMPVVDGLHVLQEMGRHAAARERAGDDDVGERDRPRAAAGVPARRRGLHPQAVHRARGDPARAAVGAREPARHRARRAARRARPTSRCRRCCQMFEQDRKTGQLSVTRDELVAWIDFVDGKIVRARVVARSTATRAP